MNEKPSKLAVTLGSILPFERKAYSRYGASMGRYSNTNLHGRVSLRRVPLDRGGYDPGGAYWGSGRPLFCAFDEEGNQLYLRASSREDAKANVLADHPDVRFFR